MQYGGTALIQTPMGQNELLLGACKSAIWGGEKVSCLERCPQPSLYKSTLLLCLCTMNVHRYICAVILPICTYVGDVMISGGIDFTPNSDLNGGSPQFTLTCISTGGPATTVTWTRDSTTVTEGTETVLDDNVTAQYTHTLTVSERLGGLYTCTVSNNKPSTASVNIIIQGKHQLV